MSAPHFCILYVDDDSNDVRLLQLASEPAGVSDCLRTVNSAPRAMDYLKGQGIYSERAKFPLPKVILLDLRMPQMNGLDLLRWLRSQKDLAGIVVIIFTASAHPDDILRAAELGANAFVQKPSGFGELTQFLQLIKSFWGNFHQSPPIREHSQLAELPKPDLSP